MKRRADETYGMVGPVGHVGMALLFLAPAWLAFDEHERAGAFVAVGTPFAVLPDVDVHLREILGTVKHHGVFHTVLAVFAAAVLLAPLGGFVLRRLDDSFEPTASAVATRDDGVRTTGPADASRSDATARASTTGASAPAILAGRTESATRLGALAILVAGFAHLFADVLSAPDISEPIEPF